MLVQVLVDGKDISESDPNYPKYYEKQYGSPPPLNGANGAMTNYPRLQRWYTYITNKIYGGARLESGSYNALQMVRNSINDAMHDIAKQSGDVDDPGASRAKD